MYSLNDILDLASFRLENNRFFLTFGGMQRRFQREHYEKGHHFETERHG